MDRICASPVKGKNSQVPAQSMANEHLCVQEVGKLLVHYKPDRPGAVRVSNPCNGIKTIQKYLKDNKAVLA